jgi:hypothetical protein
MKEKVLEIDAAMMATLRKNQCPRCYCDNAGEIVTITRVAENYVINGERYQVVDNIVMRCKFCGQLYIVKQPI